MTFEKYNPKNHFEILQKWYKDKEILDNMEIDPMNEGQLKKWLNEPDRIHLLFFQNNIPVGCVNFYHYKTKFPNYEIGYLVDKDFEGKGIATKMVSDALDYAKTKLKIEKIDEVYVKESNIGSKRVLEKNGFSFDGYNKEKGRYYFSKVL